MDLFSLPHTTKVNKVIPKNTFDSYTTTKHKKLLSEHVYRIVWAHKISSETTNLNTKEIKEIQVFKIELKSKQDIQPILDMIDKSIPYTIIFMIEYEGLIYLSTSSKHPHPINEDNSVIDWTFQTDWFNPDENPYKINLKKNIDTVFHDFCVQLSGKPTFETKSLGDIIAYSKTVKALESEIDKLKSSITNCKQFNRKVELNLKLKEVERQLKEVNNL